LWHDLCNLHGISPGEKKLKENAINTAQFVIIHRKGKYCFDRDFFPAKDSGSWIHSAGKSAG
jgi:hypothetical protein